MPSNPPPPPVPAPPPPLTVSNTDGHAPAPALAALTRFPLHTPANASSPLITCSSSTGPLPNQTLLNLRTVLVASRFAAQSRVQLKLENHKLINERVRRDVVDREHATVAAAQAQAQAQAQAAAAAAAAQAAAAAESKRREEAEAKAQAEDSKRKREQQEQLERERVEQAARMAAKQEEEVFAATGQRNGQNDQENHPASSVDRQTRPVTGSTTDESVKDGDTSMRDGSVQAPLEVASSPEPDDDVMMQPKPPRHYDKKKRKRDAVIDSDDSDNTDSTPAPEQPLLHKIRKLESTTSHQPSPSSVSTPAASTPGRNNTPSARNSPLPRAQSSSRATPTTRTNTNGIEGDDAGAPTVVSNRSNPIEARLKQERFTKHSIPIKPPAPGSATAFYVPTYPLVPVKPPVVPPVPTAKRQADVEGDFSNCKPGQQIAHSTFVNWTESYLRPFGEDDLAFLAAKPEDVSAYVIPPLGKPYQQRWEEEDFDHHYRQQQQRTPHQLLAHQQQQQQHQRMIMLNHHHNYPNPLVPPPLPRLKPCHLSEDAMATENIFLGPLSERLMSALAFEEGVTLGIAPPQSPSFHDDDDDFEDGDDEGERGEDDFDGDNNDDADADEARAGVRQQRRRRQRRPKGEGGADEGDDANDENDDDEADGAGRSRRAGAGAAAAAALSLDKADMDAVDLEERIKRELRFIGLLPQEEVDWTKREDDEISTALRACQRLLQNQVEVNETRKSILMSIVKDRMAYQEYETARDAQERVIEAGWHKRQRTDSKKKKKSGGSSSRDKDRDRSGNSNKIQPGGAGDDDPSKVPVSPVLMDAVEKRNALVESFKPFFDEEGGKSRWWGIPETSVYEGMLDAIEEEGEDRRHDFEGGGDEG